MSQTEIQKERGVYIVTLAIAIAAVVVALGFGIDSANLMKHRHRAQRAADAGVSAGLEILALGGTPTEAQNAAKRVCNLNLAQYGVTVVATTCQPTIPASLPDPSLPYPVRVDATYPAPVVFMALVPGAAGRFGIKGVVDVRASAGGEAPVLKLSLVVDHSSSMNYLASSGSISPPVGSPSRMTRLEQGSSMFLDAITGSNHKIGLVGFSTFATDQIPLALASTTHRTAIKTAIQALDTNTTDGYVSPYGGLAYVFSRSNTNISDGLKVATKQFAAEPTGMRRIILMTDGAPSGASVEFPTSALHPTLQTAVSNGTVVPFASEFGGAANFLVTWVRVTFDEGSTTEKPRKFHGAVLFDGAMQPVSQCGTTLVSRKTGSNVFFPGVVGLVELPNLLADGTTPNSINAYSPTSTDDRDFNYRTYIKYRTTPQFANQNCLSDLSFVNPVDGTSVPSMSAVNHLGLAMLYNRVTISMSDWARSKGITVLGILCGTAPDYENPAAVNPNFVTGLYRAPIHDNWVKSMLLVRLTNASTHPLFGGGGNEYDGLHLTGSSVPQWGQLPKRLRGELFEAPTGDQLREAFAALLRKIQRRLTE